MTDAQRSTVTDYDELIGRLDLPTKVRLLTGAATFNLYDEESMGSANCGSPTVRPEYGD